MFAHSSSFKPNLDSVHEKEVQNIVTKLRALQGFSEQDLERAEKQLTQVSKHDKMHT